MSKKVRKPGFAPRLNFTENVGFDPTWVPPKPQGVDWLTLFGFQLGDEVVIFPIGLVNQSLQGELIDVALKPDGSGPIMVTIRNAAERPNVSIPWSSIMMITKAEGPRVDVKQPAETTLADLVEFAEAQGIDIPEEVRTEAAIQAFADEIYSEDAEDEFGSLVTGLDPEGDYTDA